MAREEYTQENAEMISEMANDVKAFVLMVAHDEKLKPSIMMSGIAVALVELNYDYTKGDEADKDACLEDMINVFRVLHAHYAKSRKAHAAKEADEARKRGNIQ